MGVESAFTREKYFPRRRGSRLKLMTLEAWKRVLSAETRHWTSGGVISSQENTFDWSGMSTGNCKACFKSRGACLEKLAGNTSGDFNPGVESSGFDEIRVGYSAWLMDNFRGIFSTPLLAVKWNFFGEIWQAPPENEGAQGSWTEGILHFLVTTMIQRSYARRSGVCTKSFASVSRVLCETFWNFVSTAAIFEIISAYACKNVSRGNNDAVIIKLLTG